MSASESAAVGAGAGAAAAAAAAAASAGASAGPSASAASTERKGKLSGAAWQHCASSMLCVSVSMAHRLGLLQLLAEAPDAAGLSSAAVAEALHCNERMVRELLLHLAAGGFLNHSVVPGGDGPEQSRYTMDADQREVLLDPESPFASGMAMRMVPELLAPKLDRHLDTYKTGRGVSYDEGGPALAKAIAVFTSRHEQVVKSWLRDDEPDMHARFTETGGMFADIGCGSGRVLVQLALAYPKLECHGYDTSSLALENAAKAAADAGVSDRVFLHNPSTGDGFPSTPTFDMFTTIDVLHDMHDCRVVMAAARKAAKPGCKWFGVEPTGGATNADKLEKPISKLLLGFSNYVCLTAAMAESGTAGSPPVGLGTMGWSATVAKEFFLGAGWQECHPVTLPGVDNEVTVAVALD